MGKPLKHKRKGPKSTRAGCLMCKPFKDQAYSQRDTVTHPDLEMEESDQGFWEDIAELRFYEEEILGLV